MHRKTQKQDSSSIHGSGCDLRVHFRTPTLSFHSEESREIHRQLVLYVPQAEHSRRLCMAAHGTALPILCTSDTRSAVSILIQLAWPTSKHSVQSMS